MENNYNYCDPQTQKDVTNASAKHRYNEKSLKCCIYQDVFIVPSNSSEDYPKGEVLMHDGTLVSGVNPNINYDSTSPQSYFVQETAYETQCVVYLGTVNNCWGHYFTDGFSKVWWLFTDEYQMLKQRSSPKLLVTVPYTSTPLFPNSYKELLRLLGIDEEIEVTHSWKQYTQVYVPDSSLFMNNRHREYTKEFRWTIDRLMSRIPDVDKKEEKKYEKIYLSRAHWVHKNADFGEHAIECLFKHNGYTVLYPERIPIEKQLAIYKATKSMASTSGSIAHNSIFCSEGTELIILTKDHATPDYQMAINQLKDLNVTWIMCHLSIFVTDMPNLGPFFMYINDYVCQFAKERFDKTIRNNFSAKSFMRYVKLCLKKSDFKRRIQPISGLADEYYELLFKEMNNHKSVARKMADLLDTLGLEAVKDKLKYYYCKLKRG